MADMEEAMRLMPGTAKLNIHASYAIFAPGEFADRDALEPKHFAKWVEFAKKHHMGIDFNPTFFSHEKVKDGRHFRVRTRRQDVSGSITERHASASRNILQKRPECLAL